jgi:septum site-determining protein MinC
MKIKQKNLRVFELDIENYDDFVGFIEKNGDIFKESLLLIRGNVCYDVESYLTKSKYCYKNVTECQIKNSSKESFELLIKQHKSEDQKKIKKDQKCDLIKKPIRSGEVVHLQNHVILLSRINSGAKVITQDPIELYDIVDGYVECNGEFMIIKKIGLGVVSFNAQKIDKNDLSDNIALIEFIDGKVQIKDIS